MCKLFLFGTPSIEYGGRSQPIRRRKARALLAYLAVTQQSHSRENNGRYPPHVPPLDHRRLHRHCSRLANGMTEE